MNPTLPQSIVDDAMEEDRASALAEYLGEFRDDIAAFLSREEVDAVVVDGRKELPHQDGIAYHAFIDMSGGRSDAAAVAIAHREKKKTVLDLCRFWKAPHNPHDAAREISEVLHDYGIRRAMGDRYAGDWPLEAFRSHGIRFVHAEKSKSELYIEALPAIRSQEVELLDIDKLTTQFSNLERRTRSGGKDKIDHPNGGYDDLCNAVSGAIVLVAKKKKMIGAPLREGKSTSESAQARRRKQLAATIKSATEL